MSSVEERLSIIEKHLEELVGKLEVSNNPTCEKCGVVKPVRVFKNKGKVLPWCFDWRREYSIQARIKEGVNWRELDPEEQWQELHGGLTEAEAKTLHELRYSLELHCKGLSNDLISDEEKDEIRDEMVELRARIKALEAKSVDLSVAE